MKRKENKIRNSLLTAVLLLSAQVSLAHADPEIPSIPLVFPEGYLNSFSSQPFEPNQVLLSVGDEPCNYVLRTTSNTVQFVDHTCQSIPIGNGVIGNKQKVTGYKSIELLVEPEDLADGYVRRRSEAQYERTDFVDKLTGKVKYSNIDSQEGSIQTRDASYSSNGDYIRIDRAHEFAKKDTDDRILCDGITTEEKTSGGAVSSSYPGLGVLNPPTTTITAKRTLITSSGNRELNANLSKSEKRFHGNVTYFALYVSGGKLSVDKEKKVLENRAHSWNLEVADGKIVLTKISNYVLGSLFPRNFNELEGLMPTYNYTDILTFTPPSTLTLTRSTPVYNINMVEPSVKTTTEQLDLLNDHDDVCRKYWNRMFSSFKSAVKGGFTECPNGKIVDPAVTELLKLFPECPVPVPNFRN